MDIRVSFTTAYLEANEYFKSKLIDFLHNMIIDLFYSFLGLSVEDLIMNDISNILPSLNKEIPSTFNEILDIDTFSREILRTALRQRLSQLVDKNIIDPYVKSWKNFVID